MNDKKEVCAFEKKIEKKPWHNNLVFLAIQFYIG